MTSLKKSAKADPNTDKYKELVSSIRNCLSPDLLTSAWRQQIELNKLSMGNLSTSGHCYVACEAVYHFLGGKSSGWLPKTMRHGLGTHWFLQHADGSIIDPTWDQFVSPPDYTQGRGCGFLTSQPSKRATILLDRMKKSPGFPSDPRSAKSTKNKN